MHRIACLLALIASLVCPSVAVAQTDALAHLSLSDEEFLQRINRLIEVRSRAYRFADECGILHERSPKLSRAQGNTLRSIAADYLRARASVLPEAESVASLFHFPGLVRLDESEPTNIHLPLRLAQYADGEPRKLSLNPNDVAGRRLLRQIQRGLVTGMVLMDSFRIAVEPYVDNPSMRYLLTYDVSSSDTLRELARRYHAPETKARLAHATRFVDDYMAWLRRQQRQPDEVEAQLYALTQSTLWYGEIRKAGIMDLASTLLYLGGDLHLRGRHAQQMLSHGVSMGFGNIVGLVQTRRGRLARLSESEQAQLAAELKPLDILLEKTPFRLTDKLIPGHYGHVAIWLGSEEELRAMGVWDEIPPGLQTKIRAGHRIVEALRGGVTLSTLGHFLNIDDLLVLRDQRRLEPEYQRVAVRTALAQVGKEYDFNFDVYTDQRIVCSELAYVVFPDMPWPLERSLGRYTISPDNVAQVAVRQPAMLAPAVLYRDGRRIQQDLLGMLARLIGEPPSQLATAGGK